MLGVYVKIKNFGLTYPSYYNWANKYGLKNFMYTKSIYDSKFEQEAKNKIYKVIAIGCHEGDKNLIIYGIEDEEGQQLIIRKQGVKEVTKIDNNKNYMLELF